MNLKEMILERLRLTEKKEFTLPPKKNIFEGLITIYHHDTIEKVL